MTSDDTPPHGIPRPFIRVDPASRPVILLGRVEHGRTCRKPIAECYVCSRTFDLIPKGDS